MALAAACERGPAPPTAAPSGPAAIDSALAAAERAIASGDAEGAAAIAARVAAQAPRDCRRMELSGRILYLRGLQAGAAGDAEEAGRLIGAAHDSYREAIACEPDPPAGLHQSAGEIAAAAGRLEGALGHFQAASGLDPANPRHPLYEAQMFLRLGRAAEAREAIARVLDLDPAQPFAHATLAAADVDGGDCAGALAHIEEARRREPRDLALRIHEASIRRRCRQARQALELLAGLDEATRAQEMVTAEIAECWRALGEPASAAAAWELRYRHDPRDPSAWRAAARAADLHREAGDGDAARWWQAASAAARTPARPPR